MKELAETNADLEQEIVDVTEDGNALAVEGAHDEALEAYDAAWKLLPEPKTEWAMISNWIAGSFYNSLFAQNKFTEAKNWAELELYTRESDIDVGPWMHLGIVNYELGDEAQAYHYFKKAYDFGKARVFKEEPKKYHDFYKKMTDLQ